MTHKERFEAVMSLTRREARQDVHDGFIAAIFLLTHYEDLWGRVGPSLRTQTVEIRWHEIRLNHNFQDHRILMGVARDFMSGGGLTSLEKVCTQLRGDSFLVFVNGLMIRRYGEGAIPDNFGSVTIPDR